MRREILGIVAVLLLGLVAAAVVWSSQGKSLSARHTDGHDHSSHAGDHQHNDNSGPHGGKILREGDLELEILIFERGCPPHFRVYPFKDHKPVAPEEIQVSVQLERLGERTEAYRLKQGPGFLFGEEEIRQPHSFFVKVEAQWKSEKCDWEYSQYNGRLTLPADLSKQMGIETTAAGPGTIESAVQLPGEIAFNSDRVSHVVPRVAGVVLDCRRSLGDSVKSGEILAIIDSRELGEARSRYLVAAERARLANYNFERALNLLEKQTIPEKEFLTTQKAHVEEKIELTSAARKLVTLGLAEADIEALRNGTFENLTSFPIRAAFDGTVVKKHISPGEWVKEDSEIFIIADLSTVWVEIIVYANDLNAVHLGRRAVVQMDSSGMRAEGTVSYVGPLVGEESRTARARVVIPNLDGRWRPGQFVRVSLIQEAVRVPVTVRNQAIQTHKDRSVVFVNHDDQFEAQPVELGRTDGVLTEIRKGLEEGERYVSRNSFILKGELGKAGMEHQH